MSDIPPAPAADAGPLFRRFWRDYLRGHWIPVVIAGVLMTVEGSTLALLARVLEPLFDRVFVAREAGAMWWVGGLVLGLFVLRAVTSVASRALLTGISARTAARMQTDLLGHVLTLDGKFFHENPPGALIDRVLGDTAAVQGMWTLLLSAGGRDLISLVLLFGVCISIDPVWTVAALVGAPILVLPARLVQRYLRRKSTVLRDAAGQRSTRLDEMFHGITAVKQNGNEAYQLGRFATQADRIVTAQVKTDTIQSMMPAMIDIITGIGFFGVLLMGGQQIIAGDRTVGEFMSFFTAMTLAFQPLRRLGGFSGSWQIAKVSLGRLYALFDRPAAILPPATPRRPAPGATTITFESVVHAYGDVPVLNGLSFTAEAGKTTALVGPSGAGKSTVFNLLTRLVDPVSGRITLGGVPISDIPLAELRAQFSVVSQDAALFDETLRDNITLGAEVSEAAIARAVEAAHVAEFVAGLPQGLDTPAGPRGSGLSGGQRQRIAIARAVLRDAPILLLDEATSALDAASERQVTEALGRLAHGRTTLVIAHRLSTVREADKIVVIVAGRVIEEGTHDELLARGGPYADLCRLQLTA